MKPCLMLSVICLSLLMPVKRIAADGRITGDLRLYNTLSRNGENGLDFQGLGAVSLGFGGDSRDDIDAEIRLSLLEQTGTGGFALPALIRLDKLFIKFMVNTVGYPVFIIGKNRLTWGNGVVFNSADIIYGSLTPQVNFLASEIRSETAWLTSCSFEIGGYLMAELLLLPPAVDPSAENSSIGGRIVATFDFAEIEGGYLYRGDNPFDANATGHRFYIAGQSQISLPDVHLFDYYFSSALTVSDPNDTERIGRSWNISLGLFRALTLNRDQQLSLRLEALLFPLIGTESALFLYPELIWSLEPSGISVIFRSVIVPLEPSLNLFLSADWNLYSTLHLTFGASLNIGDENSAFRFDGEGGFAFLLGASYAF